MARKLNWQKASTDIKVIADDEAKRQEQSHFGDFALLLKNKIWPIKGKYYGQRIDSLPTHYLIWIKTNFNKKSPVWTAVIQELNKW